MHPSIPSSSTSHLLPLLITITIPIILSSCLYHVTLSSYHLILIITQPDHIILFLAHHFAIHHNYELPSPSPLSACTQLQRHKQTYTAMDGQTFLYPSRGNIRDWWVGHTIRSSTKVCIISSIIKDHQCIYRVCSTNIWQQ